MRSLSPNTYCHNEKTGVKPRKGAYFEQEREVCPVPDAGEKSGAGTPLPGGWKPQSHGLHRTGHRLLSGLPQRQRRRTVPPHRAQVLCGWPAGTDGGPDVLSTVQAGRGTGYGSRYPGGRLSIQRGGSPATPCGKREECEADQRPRLPGSTGTGSLGGGR